MLNKNNFWFTLIEILTWILIVSIVMIWGFQALSSITIWKVRLIQKTNIEKDSFYFTERLFEEIKKWWTIDYEEYFNRKVVWTSYASGHYLDETGFWNFGNGWNVWTNTFWWWFYHCVSWIWIWNKLLDTWCYTLNIPQRYGQYSFQFIDYNSNYDDDWWDEDWDWNIIWDDDDEYLWLWPSAFTWWTDIKEIYLISWDKKKRTLFRWNVWYDPDHPTYSWATQTNTACDFSDASTPTWSWCLWTIEFLKLEWKDWWFDHDTSNTNTTWEFDWLIDTWIIDNEFSWL